MHILIIILIVNGQFNSYSDIKTIDFKSLESCSKAKNVIMSEKANVNADLKLICTPK